MNLKNMKNEEKNKFCLMIAEKAKEDIPMVFQ